MEASISQAFCNFGTATIHEAMDMKGALDWNIKPLARGMKFCGPATTVLAQSGDNLVLHRAIYEAKPGDVLVIAATNGDSWGYWGEVMTTAAQQRGLAALVIEGGVRDSEQIIQIGFPVFSRAICIRGTEKLLEGRINCSINIGGVVVHPGDIVVGDDDGVVAFPAKCIDTLEEDCRRRIKKEEEMMEKLKQGVTTLELLNIK